MKSLLLKGLYVVLFPLLLLWGLNFNLSLRVTKPQYDEGAAAFLLATAVTTVETVLLFCWLF